MTGQADASVMLGLEPVIAGYTLAAGLLLDAPARETLSALKESGLLDAMLEDAERSRWEGRGPLERLREHLSQDDASFAALAGEYCRLFAGPGKLPAPPWESVYRSPDRLVMQAPAREVFAAFLEAGLGYDDMDKCPPDHIGRELAFLASLLRRAQEDPSKRTEDLARAARFHREHLEPWAPQFCEDLERSSPGFYGAVAALIRALLTRGLADAVTQ